MYAFKSKKLTKICSTNFFYNQTHINASIFLRILCLNMWPYSFNFLKKDFLKTVFQQFDNCALLFTFRLKKSRTDSTNTRETNTRITVSINRITQTKVQAYCRAEGTICNRQ